VASTHTLEVFVMLTIMFVAVSSITSMPRDDVLATIIDKQLTVRARDTLSAWREIGGTGGCATANMLDSMVLQGIRGDHTYWRQAIHNRYGDGYDVDLTLDNYESVYPLHGSGSVVGSTGVVDWHRDDTYVMSLPGRSSASGTEPGIWSAASLHGSSIVRTEGEAVRLRAEYSDVYAHSGRTMWGLTASASGASGERTASVLWRPKGAPSLVLDLTQDHILPEPAKGRVTFTLQIAPTIAAGHILEISMPSDWSQIVWHHAASELWEQTADPRTVGETRTITLRARQDMATSEINFDAHAPTEPARPFDVITARLSHGSLAESNLIVTYPVPSTERSLPRVLAPTTPYGMRAGSEAVFGAALANGGHEIRVSSFSIEIPGGYDLAMHQGDGAPLFASVLQGPGKSKPPSGWSVSADGKRVWWQAAEPRDVVVVEDLKATDFWATVVISDAPTSIQPVHYDGPNVTLRFDNGYEATGRGWGKAPGIATLHVPPASRGDHDALGPTADGYPWSHADAALGGSRSVEAIARGPMSWLRGSGSYQLSPDGGEFVNLDNAFANASFEARTRKVPVGTLMRADGDLTSLVSKLTELGFESTLRLDLYSPPSLGCEPTASWEISSAHLPASGIKHTLLWDAGLPTPSVFAATTDGYVYRIDAAGSPTWAYRAGGKAASLEKMDRGLAGRSLLVMGEDRVVTALRAADGRSLWDAALPPVRPGEVTEAPRALYDPFRDVVVAYSGKLVQTLSPASGAPIAMQEMRDEVVDAVASANGIVVRMRGGYALLGADLATSYEETVDTRGIAASATALLLARKDVVEAYDPSTRALLASTELPRDILRTTRGEATGDTVEDLVVVLDDHDIHVFDGATGAFAWSASPSLTLASAVPTVVWPPADDIGLPGGSSCDVLGGARRYGVPSPCNGDATGELRALAAGGRSVVMGKWIGAAAVASTSESAAVSDWEHVRHDGAPSALSVGPWLTHTRAVAYGTANGNVVLYGDDGTVLWESRPSDRAGKFSFYLVVPEGGFYGSHLLVARLQWDQAGTPQEARLIDWFEVVAADGSPVPRPAYRIALSVAPRG